MTSSPQHIAHILAAIRLDAQSGQPLFRQLYNAIRRAILERLLESGTQLPPTRELALLLKVSRQTVLNAYAQLMAEGYLAGHVGRGTYVSQQLPVDRLENAAADPMQLLRPLSSRGHRLLDDRTRLNVHQGPPRAFAIGMPGVDAFPFGIWGRLEAKHWRRHAFPLGYADPAGYAPLRELLAAYLRNSRGVHCSAEQVIITSGSQQGLFLTASMLLSPGDAAWMEMPGYPGTSTALHAVGAHVRGVPVDQDGIDVQYGATHFSEAKLAYVTPSHQYPLGVTMSLQRRLALLDYAARQRMWIVEDEYDSEYRYTSAPIASLQSLDRAGCVIYVGTLSKVLFPGLRLGYLVVPPALVEAFVRAKAAIDRHTATLPQVVLADFIAQGHFARHLRRMRDLYAERCDALRTSMDQHLGEYLLPGPMDAGFHVATALAHPTDDRHLAQVAHAAGIEVRALSPFYDAIQPDTATGTVARSDVVANFTRPSGLLLGFAAVPPEAIRTAAISLTRLLKHQR